jgi:hypothetical protein
LPTWDKTKRFLRDWDQLNPKERKAFMEAVGNFVADLRSKGFTRPSLRVKGVQGAPGVYEMTWAGDGRATFEYGPEVKLGQPHIIWRRVGGHDIFKEP